MLDKIYWTCMILGISFGVLGLGFAIFTMGFVIFKNSCF